MKRILDYLTSVPAWYLATSVDDQPHVRPFSYAAIEDGRLWFCTGKEKDVCEELKYNPRLELSAWKPGSAWLIVSGDAVFSEPSPRLRKEGFAHMVGLGEEHDCPDDGLLVFFHVENGHARICDITGEEETFTF